MKGLGFLIWKLQHVIPPAAQIAVWKEIGVEWVSIKVRDYTNEYNRYAAANSGSFKLEDFIIACREAGISVGTWQFIYTTNLARQAQLVSQDIEKFGLDHLMVDVEQNGRVYPYAQWKVFPKYKTEQMAKEYMDNLNVPAGFPVGLCSYRFPELHYQVPYGAFLHHPKMTMVNPQVYWMHANNPGYQFSKSKAEYAKMCSLPFIPIGSAYEEGGWMPSAKEIAEFNELAEVHTGGTWAPAWGYYRWGQAKNHQDWLQAMKVEVPEPPPPLPPLPPPPPVVPKARLLPDIKVLRIRSGPSIAYPMIGRITGLPEVEILERKMVTVAIPGDTEWFRIGYEQWTAAKYAGVQYLEEL